MRETEDYYTTFSEKANKKELLYAGVPYFPKLKAKYHQAKTLSLLCSEWEEVVHISVKHRQTKTPFYLSLILRDTRFCHSSFNEFGNKIGTNQLFEIEINALHNRESKVIGRISAPQLKPLPVLHLESINLVVF